MFKYLRKLKGQSTIEFAILIVIIIGALLLIQVYVKRGVQGRLKSAADDIGEQFSPGNTNLTITTVTSSRTKEGNLKGKLTQTLESPDITTVTTNQKIINVDREFWGGK